MKIVRFALALSIASLLAGCADDPFALELTPSCNPVAASSDCMLPFPSAFHEKDDASSPTGVRVNLDPMMLPLRDGVTPIDVSPYNAADGFSPVVPILVHFAADIDTDPLPSQFELEQSIADGSTVALFNMETGKRVLFFAEMDENRRDDYPDRYALILRPQEPMDMGARHLVVIKDDLRDRSGAPLAPPPVFKALRDGAAHVGPAIDAMRPKYDAIFDFARERGYARERILLAWDFQVASEDYLLGSVLSMRDAAMAASKSGELGYTLTKITNEPNEYITKIIEGDFEVPTFLREDDTFDYDPTHRPRRQPVNRKYPFTMIIPQKAKLGEPLPLVVLGHGIFGQGREFLTGSGDGVAIQQLAQEMGAVGIATDWIGLSQNDLLRIAAEVAPNLDRLGIVTDQLQQALINTLVMTKLAKGALQEDPMVKVTAAPLIDTTRIFYWGASLGGIQGSAFISISDDIERAAFGVPGSAWSTMLSRSIVFPSIRTLLEPHYPDPLGFTLAISVFQGRFDHPDPANITKLMFKSPLPDAPKDRRVILQEAIGDSQVPNMTSELLARAMGVSLLTPSVTPVYGLPEVTGPTTSSVLVQYQLPDFDNPLPPDSNTPPSDENGVHHAMNFLSNVHTQIAALFFTGEIPHTCDGPCDPM